MNRRGFFKLALGVIATAMVAPKLLLAADPKIPYVPGTAAAQTSMDRINLRHMALKIQKSLDHNLFELNDSVTRKRVVNETSELLEDYKKRRALYEYRVVCDESNNTPNSIDRNSLQVDIFIQPKREIKFNKISCLVGRKGVDFPVITS